jgi:hypothetical protein
MLGLCGLGWLWSLALTIAALAGARVSRPRFEAAGLTLGIGLVAFAWLRARAASTDTTTGEQERSPRTLILVPIVAAVLAFGWSLTIGPLSDDFVLWRWATAGTLAPRDWPYFRPLAVAMWRGVLAIGGGWIALHVVNVVLHAFNSALVGRIGSAWLGWRAGLAAGVLFAAFPASAEAVAWTAGVFDLLATASVLSAVAIAWWMPRSAGRNLALIGVCAAGTLSKESAIVIPAMLFVVTLLTPRRSRSTDWAPVLVSTAVAAAFLVVRTIMSPAVVAHFQTLPVDRRGWKDLLVRPFAGVALPVHAGGGAGPAAYLSAILVLAVIGVILFRGLREVRRGPAGTEGALRASAVAIGACWIILGALPLLGEFYVSPDLEGGRYLYLPSAGFAWLVSAALVGKGSRTLSAIAGMVLLALVGTYAFGLRVERRVWTEAAATRDAILSGVAAAVRATPCRSVQVDGAPEDVDGAYVFRSGLREALAAIPLRPDGGVCVLRWTGTMMVARTGG